MAQISADFADSVGPAPARIGSRAAARRRPECQSHPTGAVIGFKRAEGVINPVYDSAGLATTGGAKYRDEAYSVLAVLRGGASAGSTATSNGDEDNVGAKISGGQWFATGEAAKILARQPGIAGAISGSPDIAEAEAKIRGIAQGIPTAHQPIAIAAMKLAYTQLKTISDAGNTEARDLKQRLDAAALSLSGDMPFEQYQYDVKTHNVAPVSPSPTYGDTADRFNNVLLHESKLIASIRHLNMFVTYWSSQTEQPSDYKDKQEILASQKRDWESFLKDWGNREEVVQLLEWFIAYLKGEKATHAIRLR